MGLAVALFGRNPKGGRTDFGRQQPNLRILFGLGVAAEPANFVWLGWQDLNLRMRESKSRALPLGDTPMSGEAV